MVITDTTTTTFENISIDIVGPLPETKSGNPYILTLQDNFTKYSLAIPLPNNQADTIADAFVKKKIYLHIWIAKRSTNGSRQRFFKQFIRKISKTL